MECPFCSYDRSTREDLGGRVRDRDGSDHPPSYFLTTTKGEQMKDIRYTLYIPTPGGVGGIEMKVPIPNGDPLNDRRVVHFHELGLSCGLPIRVRSFDKGRTADPERMKEAV